ESLDRAIFLLVGLVLVLNVMVEGKDELFGIVNLFCSNRLELAHDRRRVVMGHDVERADGDEIAGSEGPLRPFRQVRLRDFFNDGLRHGSIPDSRPRLSGRAKLGYLLFCISGRGLAFADGCFFPLISAFISAMSLLTEPIFSRLQIASFNFFCADDDSTPSASAENFSSISRSLSGFLGSPLG